MHQRNAIEGTISELSCAHGLRTAARLEIYFLHLKRRARASRLFRRITFSPPRSVLWKIKVVELEQLTLE
jgi:hypothetical protein